MLDKKKIGKPFSLRALCAISSKEEGCRSCHVDGDEWRRSSGHQGIGGDGAPHHQGWELYFKWRLLIGPHDGVPWDGHPVILNRWPPMLKSIHCHQCHLNRKPCEEAPIGGIPFFYKNAITSAVMSFFYQKQLHHIISTWVIY